MKKNLAVIILTSIVFLSAVFLGFSTVYTVDIVTLDPIIISQESSAEVEEIHKRLSKAYDKKSYFSVDKKAAQEVLSDFPYFRLSGFEKDYPNRLIVRIKEDEEVYAVPIYNEAGQYYILGESGTVLGTRDSYVNRLDKENNVLIRGIRVEGKRGSLLSGEEIFSPLFTFCQTMSQALKGIRKNVTDVEVIKLTQTEMQVKITMNEGVKIYVGDIFTLPKEKAEKAMEKYFSLSDENKLAGRIFVVNQDEKVFVNYSPVDEFA